MKRGFLLLLTLLLAAALLLAACQPTEETATEQQPNNSQLTQPTTDSDNSNDAKPAAADEATQSDDNTANTSGNDSAANNGTNTNSGNGSTGNSGAQSTGNSSLHCSLEVRCDTILANLEQLDPAKQSIIPTSGVIYSNSQVSFSEGESVLDVLLRELRSAGIPMEYVSTPGAGGAYIEGIANIYELDCGSLSGWMYRVNGAFPNYSCSEYILSNGDRISLLYTCDLGADIGGSNAAGN